MTDRQAQANPDQQGAADVDQDQRDKSQLHLDLTRVWSNLPGLGGLAAVNHGTIGMRFMLTGVVFFLIGGVLAMLLRSQLAIPENTLLNADQYSQIFTMHGTIMMFLFAIPVLEGLAIYMIPKMIGARDLLFPRISAFGYYCYLFGGIIILSSLALGVAPDAGWFMYTPLSSIEFSPGPGSDFWLLGITFVEISAMAAGVELTVSILRGRAPGMTLFRMPVFVWSILAMALMILFGFPPLILASILLELERAAGMPFFDVAGGSDPLLWQHLFWLFGHPEVYIIFLPAAGVVSMLIQVLARRSLAGYHWVVMGMMLIAFLSFGLWVHHMFTVGIPKVAAAFFSIASMLVAIPTGILVFAWLATLWSGRVVFRLPMLWLCGFLVIFVCGGLTGVMLALVPFNWQVHDTHFVVAHMHYVLVGSLFFPLVAGLYYWLPLFSGRMPSEVLGRFGFWLSFVGFNITFLLMHLTGLLGMPRRVFFYESGLGWDWLNLLSSVGGFVMAAGVAMVLVDVATHVRFGRKSPANPWNADTLEWALDKPPPAYNFISLPDVETRHPLWLQPQLSEHLASGKGYLADAGRSRRETLWTDTLDARPLAVAQIPGNSWLPLCAALAMAAVCITLLLQAYTWAALATLVALGYLLRWSWVNGAHPAMTGNMSAGSASENSDELPLQLDTRDGPGRWGMLFTLVADATLYISLVFAWIYLWAVSPGFTASTVFAPAASALMTSALLVVVAGAVYRSLARRISHGNAQGAVARLVLVIIAGLLHLGAAGLAIYQLELQYLQFTRDALVLFMFVYVMCHSGLGIVATALQLRRLQLGFVGTHRPYEFLVLQPLWMFSMVVFLCSLVVFFALPAAWGTGA